MCLRLFVLPSKSATCHLAALFTIGYVDFYSSGLSLLCIMGIFGAWPPRQKCSVFCTKMRQLGCCHTAMLAVWTVCTINWHLLPGHIIQPSQVPYPNLNKLVCYHQWYHLHLDQLFIALNFLLFVLCGLSCSDRITIYQSAISFLYLFYNQT